MRETLGNIVWLFVGGIGLVFVAIKPKTFSFLAVILLGAWIGTELTGGLLGTTLGLAAGAVAGLMLVSAMLALQLGFQKAELWWIEQGLAAMKGQELVSAKMRIQQLENEENGPYLYAWLSFAICWAVAAGLAYAALRSKLNL